MTMTETPTTMAADAAPAAERLRVDAAMAFDLYSQVKQAHWAVVGDSFIAIHELFDRQASALRGHVDALAERLRQLGGVPSATARQTAGLTELPDLPNRVLPVTEAVSCVADRYELLAKRIKESAALAAEADDIATEDIYIQMLRDLDMQTWFLRSHLH